MYQGMVNSLCTNVIVCRSLRLYKTAALPDLTRLTTYRSQNAVDHEKKDLEKRIKIALENEVPE